MEDQRHQEVGAWSLAWLVCIRNGARVKAGRTFKKLMHSPILETIKTHPLQGTGAKGGRPEAWGTWTLADDGWSAGAGGGGACVGRRVMWNSENGPRQAQRIGLSNSSTKKALEAGPPD